MPGLRYGPDITDDAALLMNEERKLRARLRATQSPKTRTNVQNRLKAIESVTKDIFGSRTSRNKLAAYSLEKMGYTTGPRGGGRKLRRSPVGRSTEIPRRSGFRARPAIAEGDRDSYRSATKKARGGQVADALKAAQNQSRAKTKQARAAAARKAAKAKTEATRKNNRNR